MSPQEHLYHWDLCRVPVGVSPGHHSTSGSGWVGWSIIQVGPPDAPFLSCGFTVPSSLHKDITQHWPGVLPVSASKASQCPPQCSLPCGLYVLFPLFAILEAWGRFLPFPPALTAKCWHLARQRGSLTCVHGKEGPDTSAGVIYRETPLPAGIIEVTPGERHFQIL